MKKFDFKTRIQWKWYTAAFFGIALALLAVPNFNDALGITNEDDTLITVMNKISYGDSVKVMLNGDTVALAKSEEAGKAAFNEARLTYNKDGIRILDVDVDFEKIDVNRDKKVLKGKHVQGKKKLSDTILKSFDDYANKKKELAYTMRIDDYTVTVDSMESLVSALEKAQGKYDVDDSFKVGFNPPASRNVTMYEVGITEKAPEKVKEEATSEEKASEESNSEDESSTESISEEGSTEETKKKDKKKKKDEEVLAQAENDGVKFIGFSEKIQVMETYVNKDLIKSKKETYGELTAENQEPSIYVVEPGDCLSIIAEKNNMTVEDIKALNPTIESDDDIYYDDRLNITVPKAAVQILVEKQVTYKEDYYEDVVYENDSSMYIGETEVVQEGTPGKHVVTDLVTYTDDIESKREQLEETVEVAAVAQIVKRGTKSKPTYMYPVTNWYVTSSYGTRWGRLHAGIDVGIPTGTTVRASRGGRIINAGWLGGYGNCVMIDHGDGVVTVYGHLSEFSCTVGDYVNQGQQIALSGNTGRSTGPHLHFEMRVNGSSVDPAPYLSN